MVPRREFGLLLVVLSLATAGVRAQVAWEKVPALGLRTGAEAFFDVSRGRVVLFGGQIFPGIPQTDLWEWDGGGWTWAATTTQPTATRSQTIAYDSARRRIVLVSSDDSGSAPETQTWEFDGATWTRHHPTTSPEPREHHAMVYDVARQRTVLFGGEYCGRTGCFCFADTWEWDGATWILRSPAVSPPGRCFHAMVYDAARQRCVLFGGRPMYTVVDLDDTWEWDGTSWLERRPPIAPPPRSNHAFAWDAHRQRVVLFGGSRAHAELGDTWEWDGTDWTQRLTVQAPRPRAEHTMAYDPVRQRVVLLGGRKWENADTWEYDGSAWSMRSPRVAPSVNLATGMVYDDDRQRIVEFGEHFAETWEWDGRWQPGLPAAGRPEPRADVVIAFDSRRRRVVLFGGRGATFGSPLRDDTWEWAASGGWVRRAPATVPPARGMHRIAYDAGRARVVMFGGFVASSTRDDTWEWDGTDWLERTPAIRPPARTWQAMAYDAGRARILMFGGLGSGGELLDDTWEWDGTDWLARMPETLPPGGCCNAMIYDSARRRVVMLDDGRLETWEWDGVDWLRRATAITPTDRWIGSAAYDAARGAMLWLGLETWRYFPTVIAVATPHGTGCPGSSGVPTIAATAPPLLGSRTFGVRVDSARPQSPVAIGLSTGSGGQPLPGGCTLYLQAPWLEVSAVSGAAGVATVAMRIPLDPVLRGAVIETQGFVLDPRGTLLGALALTGGLTVRIGD